MWMAHCNCLVFRGLSPACSILHEFSDHFTQLQGGWFFASYKDMAGYFLTGRRRQIEYGGGIGRQPRPGIESHEDHKPCQMLYKMMLLVGDGRANRRGRVGAGAGHECLSAVAAVGPGSCWRPRPTSCSSRDGADGHGVLPPGAVISTCKEDAVVSVNRRRSGIVVQISASMGSRTTGRWWIMTSWMR